MKRRLACAAAAMLLPGCGAVDSMTEHWFYGRVAELADQRICLGDARAEDPDAERCFERAGVPVDADEGDLVRVRYERDESGHGGGRATRVVPVRRMDSDA